MENRRILTVSELAAHLNVHRITIYRLLKAGNLPGFKIGRVWRFDLDEIGAWMDNGKASNTDHKGTDHKGTVQMDGDHRRAVQTDGDHRRAVHMDGDHRGSAPDPRSLSRRSFEQPQAESSPSGRGSTSKSKR